MRNIIGTPIPRGRKQHECQSAKGDYEWDNSCGEECYRVIVPKCSGSDNAAEPDVRILKANVEGCDWEMQLVFRGNDYMPVLIIYLKGLC